MSAADNTPAVMTAAQQLCKPIELKGVSDGTAPSVQECIAQSTANIKSGLKHLDIAFAAKSKTLADALSTAPSNIADISRQLTQLAEQKAELDKIGQRLFPWLELSGLLGEGIQILAQQDGILTSKHLDALARPNDILNYVKRFAGEIADGLTEAGMAGDLTVMFTTAQPMLATAASATYDKSQTLALVTMGGDYINRQGEKGLVVADNSRTAEEPNWGTRVRPEITDGSPPPPPVVQRFRYFK